MNIFSILRDNVTNSSTLKPERIFQRLIEVMVYETRIRPRLLVNKRILIKRSHDASSRWLLFSV